MKKLLNTLFVTSENAYLALDGENVIVKRDEQIVARFPLHTLCGIISFSYAGASPALMGACADRLVSLTFCTPRGKFLARAAGAKNGNVLLHRTQYRIADDVEACCKIARMMIFGKVFNARWSIERTCRDHPLRVDTQLLKSVSGRLKELLPRIQEETDLASLRGLEGGAAATYFNVINELILNNKEVFVTDSRSRRPPLDPLNALLSFSYTLLAHDCASALESVGLDSQVGFLHKDRPGRTSLALDLMEELRPCLADRFVLTCINNRVFDKSSFDFKENGAVLLTDSARKIFLKSWQERKNEKIIHPYLSDKIEWGMVPFAQALLLARHLRGDTEAYPPFLWK